MRFSASYFACACLVLVVEIAIGMFMRDAFVRPYLGDALVVVLICCAVLAVVALPRTAAALGVFMFACVVEVGQYFDLAARLNVRSPVWRTVIGTSFDAHDLLAYGAGTLLILIGERALAFSRASQKASPAQRRS